MFVYNLESLKEYLFTAPVDAPTENLINWPTIFSASTRDDDKADDNDDEEDDNDNEQDGGEGNEDGIDNEEESDYEEDDEHV